MLSFTLPSALHPRVPLAVEAAPAPAPALASASAPAPAPAPLKETKPKPAPKRTLADLSEPEVEIKVTTRPLCLALNGGTRCSEPAQDTRGWHVCEFCASKFATPPIAHMHAKAATDLMLWFTTLYATHGRRYLLKGPTAVSYWFFSSQSKSRFVNPWDFTVQVYAFGAFEELKTLFLDNVSSDHTVRVDPDTKSLSVFLNGIELVIFIEDGAAAKKTFMLQGVTLDIKSLNAYMYDHELYVSFEAVHSCAAGNFPRHAELKVLRPIEAAPKPVAKPKPLDTSAPVPEDFLRRLESFEAPFLLDGSKLLITHSRDTFTTSAQCLDVLESMIVGSVGFDYAVGRRPGDVFLFTLKDAVEKVMATATLRLAEFSNSDRAGKSTVSKGLLGAINSLKHSGILPATGTSVVLFVDTLLSVVAGAGAKLLGTLLRLAGEFVSVSTTSAYLMLEAMEEPLIRYYEHQSFTATSFYKDFRFMHKEIDPFSFVAQHELTSCFQSKHSATDASKLPEVFADSAKMLKSFEESYFRASGGSQNPVLLMESLVQHVRATSAAKHAILRAWGRPVSLAQFTHELTKKWARLDEFVCNVKFRSSHVSDAVRQMAKDKVFLDLETLMNDTRYSDRAQKAFLADTSA